MPSILKELYTYPKERLDFPKDLLDVFVRAKHLSEQVESDTSPLSVIYSALSSVPIPDYDDIMRENKTAQEIFSNVLETVIWHPMFWLHPNTFIRRELSLDDGQKIYEPDFLYSFRIAKELQKSRYYDNNTGLWTDVLLEVGIDITTNAGRERVIFWQIGYKDDLLDNLTLDEANSDGYLEQALAKYEKLYQSRRDIFETSFILNDTAEHKKIKETIRKVMFPL
jgi:hypothetical protein